TANGLIPAGSWTHVAATYERTSGLVTLYVNGAQAVQQGIASGLTIETSSDLYLGTRKSSKNPGEAGIHFTGRLDETEIFNRALSQSEIQAIYKAGALGKCTCTGAASGPTAWWPGDGDGRDITGNGNTAILTNMGFALGRVGQAFKFQGIQASNIKINASPTIDIGNASTAGSTIEMWVNPSSGDVSSTRPLAEYNNSVGGVGSQFYLNINQAVQVSPGAIFANLVDTSNTNHFVATPVGGFVTANTWQHVAVTYDKASGIANVYYNGNVVGTQNIGANLVLQTTYPLFFGVRASGSGITPYAGAEDEMDVFNRALTPSEILSIYNEGLSGKYKSVATPTGGAGSTANAGSDATLTFSGGVTVAGTTQQVPLDPTQYPTLPAVQTPLGLYYDVSTSATFSGTVTVCFNLPLVTTSAGFNSLGIDHLENGVWVNRTGSLNFGTHTACSTPLNSLSPFAIGQLSPTAAKVTVSGHVLAAGGAGLRNATVTMIDGNGVTRRFITNAFGYYQFDDVTTGQSYVLGVESRRFTYASRAIVVTDTLADVDFTPQE
ncbi:MAG: carboxypeptidase regulatory-like domain-containing protein, partial [Acidobacteria bacterium]|nr:carboxypeptidase regulatory-like domain-containing protein [Acidobacteriota bacterium]